MLFVRCIALFRVSLRGTVTPDCALEFSKLSHTPNELEGAHPSSASGGNGGLLRSDASIPPLPILAFFFSVPQASPNYLPSPTLSSPPAHPRRDRSGPDLQP